uniref:Sm domain-containing protein n=1 Tax=Lotharella oceanica TaxID=641309 RepID=A0A7S2U216_9EUKA|mmetsp:Transcript_68/g.157  ORF Transcript_68/g.157 Transcript_68/m.157 type:complete len:130 (+) Transcript_68:29-418(+)
MADDSQNEPETTAQIAREDQVRSYIGKPVRVNVSDGRVMIGIFACCDDHLNIIMADTQQILDDANAKPRHLGQILVPGSHIVKVEVYQETLPGINDPKELNDAKDLLAMKDLMVTGTSIEKKKDVVQPT